jgi:2-dehydropantoate 2-reductase
MGGSIGGSLAKAGRNLLFVDQEVDHVRAMNRKGLRITGPVDAFTVQVRAATPSEVQGRFPLILLCVKSQHTGIALEKLAPHLAEDGAVVSIQNGLCEHEIAQRVGLSRTIGAFVNFGADYMEPGVVHRGNRGATVVGELDGALTERVRGIHALLRVFEPDAVLTENIFGYLWGKLAYASLLFATALTNDSIADVLADDSFRPTLIALAREAVAVATAEGVVLESFDGFDPEAFLPGGGSHLASASLDDLVRFNRASAKTHSGIWRDLAVRKRKTEVDAQLGWIVRIGNAAGVPTPLTEAVIDRIHDIESGDRPLDRENLGELGAIG